MDLSVHLQDILSDLSGLLKAATGKELPFVLVVQTDIVVQYASNCDRAAVISVLEELLLRWRLNRADIPAHYNPDLKDI